jgi:ABC-type Mn2+/Zn2+ transport system ATPase subunit
VTATAATVIAADALTIGYSGRSVISGLDLRVRSGETLALVGTNGSGKSTLLKTLVGLLQSVSGAVEVLGAPPGRSPGSLAYLSQFHANAFVLPLRARDVVRMGRFANHGLLGRMSSADDELIDAAMIRMGIEHLAAKPLRDLSGGQQQRTYLAQVLARRADLLLLDEPTAGVDAAGREVYERALREELARGAAVVVATHDITEASRADRVLLLAGRVVASGPPDEVLTADLLLDAFGVGLQRLGDGLIVTEHPHGHDHPH